MFLEEGLDYSADLREARRQALEECVSVVLGDGAQLSGMDKAAEFTLQSEHGTSRGMGTHSRTMNLRFQPAASWLSRARLRSLTERELYIIRLRQSSADLTAMAFMKARRSATAC